MFILVVKDERGALVSEHELEDVQLIVGRVGECDIVLASTAVSRQHACFFVDGDRVYVSDMGSANGVYVDEERIRGDVAVDSSSRIRLAEFLLSVEEIAVEARQPSGIITAVVAPEAAHGKLLILSGPEAGRETAGKGRAPSNGRCAGKLVGKSHSMCHSRWHFQPSGSAQEFGLSRYGAWAASVERVP